MKRKIILITYIQLVVVFTLSAQQLSYTDAQRVAQTACFSSNNDENETTLDTIFMLNKNSRTLMYEACFNNGEHFLISGNLNTIPILGHYYSTETAESIFSHDNRIPDALQELIAIYADQIEICFDNAVNNPYSDLWINYLNGEITNNDRATTLIMGTTLWGQDESNDSNPSYIDPTAYNYYAPSEPYCSKCAAGCSAVAMAQIMKYWNHPQNAPFKCEQYDWENMPDELIQKNNGNYTTERNAIARLIRDCGEYMNMTYCSNNTCSSSTYYLSQITNAFIKLGYSNVYAINEEDCANHATWVNLVASEISAGRPMFYQARRLANDGSRPGHAFVCSGYKVENGIKKFYMNWGWNGFSNGWYVLDNLNPSYTYDQSHSAVFNIQPVSCWENIIMECNKTFSSIATYMSAANKIENNFHTFAFTGGYAELTAGEEIFLTEGFSVNEGTNFLAEIESCSGTAKGDYWQYYEREDDETMEKIHESSLSAGIIIHPNPTTGTVSIILPDKNITIRQIEVRNMLGTSVLEKANMQGNTLDVSSLPAGAYIVRVVTNEGNEVFAKLVKK